jgi:hypothetical protein
LSDCATSAGSPVTTVSLDLKEILFHYKSWLGTSRFEFSISKKNPKPVCAKDPASSLVIAAFIFNFTLSVHGHLSSKEDAQLSMFMLGL